MRIFIDPPVSSGFGLGLGTLCMRLEQNILDMTGAFTALGADPEATLQALDRAGAVADRLFDLFIGYRVAKTNVHGLISRLIPRV